MNMNWGKFIVLEGGDGAGKSTAAAWLAEEFKTANIVFTREPGGTDSAEEIRETLVRKRGEELDVFTELLLFEAARREHVTKKIIPALESGAHVICDRFSAATYGYQIVAGKGQEYETLFFLLDEKARAGREPDLTVYLEVDPEIGIARKRGSGDALNIFDEKQTTFHERVNEGIRRYLRERPHIIIDANKSQEEVRMEVKRAILSYIE